MHTKMPPRKLIYGRPSPRFLSREQRQEIITAMKTVYWPAKEEIATNKYSSLLTLLEDVGVQSMKMKAGENATYRSYHTAEGMQESIRTVLH